MSIKVSEYQFLNNNSPNKLPQVKSVGATLTESEAIKTNSIPSELLKGAYGVVPFKAQASKTNSHKIPFTANPLYDINLRKLVGTDSYDNIKAKFSELIYDDIDDLLAMLKVEDKWSKIGKTDYTKMITNNFVDNRQPERHYFVTEFVDDTKELSDRITCLLETTNPKTAVNKNTFEIHFVQASPEILYKEKPEIKGSGELALYGAVKVAKENGFKKVKLFSTNDSFYEKMGFKKVGTLYEDNEFDNQGGLYQLSSSKFDAFLKKIENKYSFK